MPMSLSIGAGIVISAIIINLLIRAESRWEKFGYASILFGGGANLFERIVWGRTKDYIAINDLGAFNVADIFIVCGISVLVVINIVSLFTTRGRK